MLIESARNGTVAGRSIPIAALGLTIAVGAGAVRATGPNADLKNLAGPRGSRWGDSLEKVQRTEGRDPAVSLESCIAFRDVEIDGRKYEVSYQCFEKGGGFGSTSGWRPTRKGITTAALRLQPFGPPRNADDELGWWEKELTSKYGEPSVRLDATPSADQTLAWPNWCPPSLTNQSMWTSGDCPLPYRFTKYRRWLGKRTAIELYDVGGHGLVTTDSHVVQVVFSERAFFEAAEAARQHAVTAALKKQSEQKANQKRVPAF